MERKKLIFALGCKNGRAFFMDGETADRGTADENNMDGEITSRGTSDGETADGGCDKGSGDGLALCRRCGDDGADELLLFDLSETDEDHERTIALIRQAVKNTDIPVIAGGRARKLEDVKKYLYAGAAAVFLDVSADGNGNRDFMKEASDRFSGRIYAYLPELSLMGQADEYARLGASAIILGALPGEKELARVADSPLPVFAACRHEEEGAVAAFLKIPVSAGVILIAPTETEAECGRGGCMSRKLELKKQGIPVETFESAIRWDEFKQNSDGLVPVIVQDYRTREVLMLAYMNEEAFRRTLDTGKMTYFSRSRRSLWVKGETSGHYQYVKSLTLDCDNDTILAMVRQVGAACHTGNRSCFFRTLAAREFRQVNPLTVLETVYQVILDRKEHPKEGSYTNYLFDKGLDKILKKLGEEATEIVIAAKNPSSEEIIYEISDFLYHLMVLMADRGITWEDITGELANR